jgi:AcrR family transcriptional regulator
MATAIAIGDSERLQRRERRRQELLDAADRVIHRGGVAFSMDEIAAEAGITKPVVYRHFGDKEGLHGALTERYIRELKLALRPATETEDPRSRLAATIDAYLSYVERQPDR